MTANHTLKRPTGTLGRTCAVAQATARNKRIGNAEKRDRRRARGDAAA